MSKKRSISEKLLTDLPQRVIVHKILELHEIEIYKDEENPFLLFGYFKNDRLRNIWFVFSSVVCGSFYNNSEKVDVLKNVVVDYSKLCNVFFRKVLVPCLSQFSSRMYSLRSIKCVHCSFTEQNFYANSKFPNLKSFSLSTLEDPNIFAKNWIGSDFFDNLISLQLENSLYQYSFDYSHFLKSKEKIFQENLKNISLYRVNLEEKLVISLPNLEKMRLSNCKNLFIIPSEKKLKELTLSSTEEIFELELIAKGSRNTKIIDISGFCNKFFKLFEEEDFSNLITLKICSNYFHREVFSTIMNKWIFCYHLKELDIDCSLKNNPDFFLKNEWDQLERLHIEDCGVVLQFEGVKFPKLCFLNVFCNFLDDSFFCFEGKKLKQLDLFRTDYGFGNSGILTGEGWNEDIFKILEVLTFTDEFDDLFFQTFEFPNLRKLNLYRNETLKDRKSWKEMKNLEEIEIEGEHKYLSNWKKN